MVGKWSQAGVPHRGWSCVGVEDLGAPEATCEMCETQKIRYVHPVRLLIHCLLILGLWKEFGRKP
jgi:hypothetical protein